MCTDFYDRNDPISVFSFSYGQITTGGTVDTSKNNGQLAQVESWIGTEQQYRQQYQYDCLNRLTESLEKYGSGLTSTAYDSKFEYDTFGNCYQRSSARRTARLAGAIGSGQIDLAGGATISFIGCNTSALALDLSKQLVRVRKDISVTGISNACNLIAEVRGVRIGNETTGLSGSTLGNVLTYRQGNEHAYNTRVPERKRLVGGLW